MTDVIDTCLRAAHDPENCQGELEVWHTIFGTRIVECKFHREESIKRANEVRERYPDSPVAPSWFDPTYAGESWDED